MKDVGAVEDLMREHGVLRRAFLVYRECAGRLRLSPAGVNAGAIHDTAQLFRAFGEDYHEKKLEEAHIFPLVRRAGGEAGSYVDKLVAQHSRGREVTDYILGATASGKIGTADAEPLARAFDAFEIMYSNHTAREDTIVFPAWKGALSAEALAEMSDRFEVIEREEFGHDGFEDAVRRMAHVEQMLGFADIAQFTAPAPPHATNGSPHAQ
jgi:hemerythrin-like domain-containing protein